MKKIFFLIFGLWSIISVSAQTVTTNTAFTGTPTYNSCMVTVKLIGAPGTSYKIFGIYRKSPYTDTFTRGDSTTVTGIGFGNLKDVNLNFSNLLSNTDYQYGALLYNSSGSTLLHSADSAIYFKTGMAPGIGSLTCVIQQIVGGARAIVNYNNSYNTSVLTVSGRDSGTTGSYPIVTSPVLKTRSASYSNFIDTFYMYNNKNTNLLITLMPISGATGVVNTTYSFTPLTATKPKVNAIYSVPQYDTFGVSASITLGNVGGEKVFMRVFDSFGNLTSTTNIRSAVSGINFFNTNNWPIDKSYGLEVVVVDTLGNRDSLKVLNGWRTKIPPAPGTINPTIIPLLGRLMVIVASNNGNVQSILAVKARESGSGTGYIISANPTSKTKVASTGTTIDTFYINGLSTKLYEIEISLAPNNGAATKFDYRSATPLVLIMPKVTSITSTPGYDTFNASVYITLGNVGGEKRFMRILDSIGNVVFTTGLLPVTSGINYFNNNSWMVNRSYGLEVVVLDSLGNRDSLKILNGWRTKAVPAVTITIVNSGVTTKSAWFDIKLSNTEYFCVTKLVAQYRKNGTGSWSYIDTTIYLINGDVKRISLSGLKYSSGHEIIFTAINCTKGITSLPSTFTTLDPTLPPTITTLSVDGGCGFVRLNPFAIIPKKDDTSQIEIWVAIEPDIVPTILVDAFDTDIAMNYPGKTYNVPAGKTATFFVVAGSKDDSVIIKFASNKASQLSQPTVNYTLPSDKITDTSINVLGFGGSGCGQVVDVDIKVLEYFSRKQIPTVKFSVNKNPGQDNYTTPEQFITGLKPEMKYEVFIHVSNDGGKWQSMNATSFTVTTKPKSTSGIISAVDEDIWEKNPQVTVTDITGRVITRGYYDEVIRSIPKHQVLNFKIEDKDGRVIAQRQQNQNTE